MCIFICIKNGCCVVRPYVINGDSQVSGGNLWPHAIGSLGTDFKNRWKRSSQWRASGASLKAIGGRVRGVVKYSKTSTGPPPSGFHPGRAFFALPDKEQTICWQRHRPEMCGWEKRQSSNCPIIDKHGCDKMPPPNKCCLYSFLNQPPLQWYHLSSGLKIYKVFVKW